MLRSDPNLNLVRVIFRVSGRQKTRLWAVSALRE